MANPRVSIVMSVWNAMPHLHDALESVRRQSQCDYEFLITDDGSTDDSSGVLREYAQSDSRVILLRHEGNTGLTVRLQEMLSIARGEYIARHDADDIMLPGRLARQFRYLDRNPSVALVSGNWEWWDATNHRSLGRTLLWGDPVRMAWLLLFFNVLACHSCVMVRRSALRAAGGYDPSFRFAQDYDAWDRLSGMGDCAMIPDVLQRFSRGHHSVSIRDDTEQAAIAQRVTERAFHRLGLSFDSEEIAELQRVWPTIWWNDFPALDRLPLLEERLSAVQQAFIASRLHCGDPASIVRKRTADTVGLAFLLWAWKAIRAERVEEGRAYLAAAKRWGRIPLLSLRMLSARLRGRSRFF
jgi:hypothetical protein